MGIYTFLVELMAVTMFIGILGILGLKRKDYWSILQILSGSLFGITLEYANVYIADTYTYSSEFFIQVGSAPGNIPICIGLCWGLIIWACMNVSNRFNIPFWARAILDGLLALTIDLSMDTIAIRIEGGLWTWTGIPLETNPTLRSFFGVHYGNFLGWFYVVLIFSLLLRMEVKFIREQNKWLSLLYFGIIPLLAYIPLYYLLTNSSKPIYWLLDVNILEASITPQNIAFFTLLYTFVGVVVVLLIIFLKLRPTIQRDVDLLTIFIFMSFHVSYIFIYLISGIFNDVPLILPLAISMFIIDLTIHWFILDIRKEKELFQVEKR
jgi:hypothetical protein